MRGERWSGNTLRIECQWTDGHCRSPAKVWLGALRAPSERSCLAGVTHHPLPQRRLMAAALCSICSAAMGLICALQSRTLWAA